MREEIPLGKIKRAIESSTPPACFIFIAYEPYLAEECIQQIKKLYIDKELEEFNFDLLRGWETNYTDVCQRCLTMPMMSSYRMVVVKDADKIEETDSDSIKDYMNNPSLTTILIFLFSSTSNKASYKLLKKHGSVHYFNPLSEKAAEGWIRNQIAQKDYNIKPDAIRFFLDQTGNDMIKIENELKKLELSQKDNKEITLEDIQSLIGRSQRHNAFNLADAIGKKKVGNALKILNRLIEDGEEPLKILGALEYHFRQLMKLKHLLSKRMDDFAITSEMRLNRSIYLQLKEQSRLFSFSELSQNFQLFCQTDLLLKSSPIKAQLFLEKLILNLIMRDDTLRLEKDIKSY